MVKTFEIELDLLNKSINEVFNLCNNDKDTIQLNITIKNGLYRLDLSGKIVQLTVKKTDGTIVIQSGCVTDGVNGFCKVVLNKQAYQETGCHKAELVIQGDNETVSTIKFYYRVSKNILINNKKESTNQITSVTDVNKDLAIDTSVETGQMNVQSTELNSLVEMKTYNAVLGEIIITNGYYVSGDKGGGKYIVINYGTPDDGYLVALNNGLKAKLIHNGVIYARQYGVKLDDVTDDTARLNTFFKMFGEVKLVVNDGIALTTNTLFIKGRWREDDPAPEGKYNNSLRKLTFENSSIRYTGVPDKCCIMFWHHYGSLIEGLAVVRSSSSCYVDMSMVWYTEFKNFDVPDMGINRDRSIIIEWNPNPSVNTPSCHTLKFSKGYIASKKFTLNSKGTYINSIHFYNVTFFSNLVDYCVEFYGTGLFQNITFNYCDMSYAKKSIFYINDPAPNSSSIKLDSCYLDSSVPYTEDFQFKGFKLIVKDVIEAASTSMSKDILYTKEHTQTYRLGSYGANSDNIPTMNMNLCKNGDLFCKNQNASPGWIANNPDILFSWTTGDGSLSGNILTATFLNNATTYFYGCINAPVTGAYTAGLRMKLVSGSLGIIQVGMAGLYKHIDLSEILLNEEFILSTFGAGKINRNVGDALNFSFSLMNKGAEDVVLEIYEMFIVVGVQTRLMLPLHPKAQVFRINKATTTFSGNGLSISKIIPHGLYATPTSYSVVPSSIDAGLAEISYVTADSTNLTVYFKTAPKTGSNNVSLTWKAEV